MEWLPDSDPFIAPNRLHQFDYEFEVRTKGQHCKVIQNWGSDATQKSQVIDLPDHESWENWIRTLPFIRDGFSVDRLPENGFIIICVPRAEDVQLTNCAVPAAYTDIPIDKDCSESFEKILRAFHLPGHFPMLAVRRQTSMTSVARTHKFPEGPEGIWMHTASVNSDSNEHSFAMEATYFEKKKLTLAIMFCCSDDQVRHVRALVDLNHDAIGYPFLMLSIYIELQHERLAQMIRTRHTQFDNLMGERAFQEAKEMKDRFSWETIHKVRSTREAIRKVEVEVEATKLHAHKVLLDLQMLENSKDERLTRVTKTITERFNDIIMTLNGQSSKCRILVEDISFATDIMRSELSRQEAQTSAENARFATGIAFIAMIYLPLSTTATIFSMPIFQWSNDWRDSLYRPVDSGDTSNTGGSGGTPGSPVVSGYIWLYISITICLTVVTYAALKVYMKIWFSGQRTSILPQNSHKQQLSDYKSSS
ncbi:uncharacterized protein F4812DRAFT_460898 [Daldinia caldariorum]|uniref:uncharacterized protein n=1 Tax=Daldinia caldariorum TaxID=326644 RepID=UPI002008DED3|nr:uncharacterized protein F4812DRAFT_460898 [Daldinia caldariorum]KAI1465919.1 hypothetical protein F4812DRAFT_460898 [Daldinia caldariorum]